MFHFINIEGDNGVKSNMDISYLSLAGKIYSGAVMSRVRKVTSGLTDNEQLGGKALEN